MMPCNLQSCGPSLQHRSPLTAHRSPLTAYRSPLSLLLRLLEQPQILPVPLRLHPVHRYEPQRRRVHAVAQSGRRRAVVEDVAEVRVGVSRADLGAILGELAIVLGLEVF